jgi:O-acetylhomoserine/O-acetylserine sulfhydrylase-like pyridoxal-dependent enzyme
MKNLKLSSAAVHGGRETLISNQPEALPIYQTSVFTFDNLSHMESYFNLDNNIYLYSRNKNPNLTAFESAVSLLEGGEDAVVTSSGMSAILAAILTVVQAGDHVLCSEEIYGVTGTLLDQELSRLGIDCT